MQRTAHKRHALSPDELRMSAQKARQRALDRSHYDRSIKATDYPRSAKAVRIDGVHPNHISKMFTDGPVLHTASGLNLIAKLSKNFHLPVCFSCNKESVLL